MRQNPGDALLKILKKLLVPITVVFLICSGFYLYSCEKRSAYTVNESGQTNGPAVRESETEPAEIFRENTLLAGTEEAGSSFFSESDADDFSARHGLKRFLLTADLNPALPFSISCYISNHTVSALLPSGIDLSSVVVKFYQSGAYIKADGEFLISGQSALDLRQPAEIIVASKSGTEFTVTLRVETLNTGLPSVALTTEGFDKITSKTEYLSCGIYTGGGDKNICPYAADETMTLTGVVKGRGNTSWGFPKKGYTLKLDEKAALLDLPPSKDWTFISNYQDKTLLRNDFASKLSEAVGLKANMKTRSVDFWLNGKYWGVYLLTEKIEIEENRIDIAGFDPSLPPAKTGYLFEWDGHVQEISEKQKSGWTKTENVTYDPAQDVYFIHTTGWLVIHKPSPADITPEHLKYLFEFITRIETALDSGDFKTADRYMDLESFVQWYLVEDIMKNMDAGFWSSCYMYLDECGVLHMGPVWDFDMSLGNCNYGGCDTPDGDYISGSWYYRHLLRMPEYRELTQKIFREKYDAILSIKDYVAGAAAMLERSLDHNFSVWDILGRSVGANPENVADAATYDEQIDIMLDFFDRRLQFVSDFITGLD